MTVETSPQYPSDLNASYPDPGDNIPEGDDHIRNIKTVLKTTLPNVSGAITATHTELNFVDGVTSAIQTQLDAKAPIASPTFTGTPAAPTASVGTGTTQIATTAFVAATALVSALPGQTGNSGKIVTTDGTNASWTSAFVSSVNGSTGAVTTLTLLATLTPTAAANVDALSTFTSSYDNYLIIGQGIRPASDDTLRMQLAAAGAADTGSTYFSTVVGGAAGTAAAFITVASSVVATYGCGFMMQVVNANDATNPKTVLLNESHQSAATPAFGVSAVGGAYTAANAVTGIRFYWATGANFAAAGKIRIYGYNNT